MIGSGHKGDIMIGFLIVPIGKPVGTIFLEVCMAGSFTHETLGEYDTEERWLSIFPRDAFIRMVVGGGIGIMMFMLGNYLIAVAAVVVVGIWTILSVREHDPSDYAHGGGRKKDVLLLHKRYRKKHRDVYILFHDDIFLNEREEGKK